MLSNRSGILGTSCTTRLCSSCSCWTSLPRFAMSTYTGSMMGIATARKCVSCGRSNNYWSTQRVATPPNSKVMSTRWAETTIAGWYSMIWHRISYWLLWFYKYLAVSSSILLPQRGRACRIERSTKRGCVLSVVRLTSFMRRYPITSSIPTISNETTTCGITSSSWGTYSRKIL